MKLICFSGACRSGKTTLINRLKTNFGDQVVVINELIRGTLAVLSKSIDELRDDAKTYLEVQDQIINGKISQEDAAKAHRDVANGKLQVALVDRSTVDSLYYLLTYAKPASNPVLFTSLVEKLILRNHWPKYDKVFLCEPIKVEIYDAARPSDIDVRQDKEWESIVSLTDYFLQKKSLSFLTTKDITTKINVMNPSSYDIVCKYITACLKH